MQVFISWAGADREVKNAIVARLKKEKVDGKEIDCWESDEKCNSDFSAECIRNIRNSAVFVVLVSEASMDPRSYVFSEVIEARRLEGEGSLNILVYKLTDEPYTERFAMQLNHVSDANHVARLQRLGSMGGIETLVKRVKYLLHCRAEGVPEKPYDVLVPHVIGTQVPTGGYFVENSRDDVIDAISEGFSRSNVVILSELFGFGKKSVLRRYVTHHGYKSAVEIQGLHEPLSRFLLEGLHFSNVNEAAFDGDERSVIRKKIDFLKKLDETHLLIVSDVDIEDEADDYVVGLLGELKCHVAFLTQNTADAYRDFFPVIPVGRMRSEYLLELFFHYYDRQNCLDRAPLIPLLERFFDEVGGHTKTVELAASVLSKEMRADPEELAQYLAVGADDKRTLNERIVDKLSELITMENFDAAAQRTLLLIALLANPTLEVARLYSLMEACGVGDRSVITELDNHRWISYDARNRTVHIEPMIAEICVNKLLSDYEVPRIAFSFLLAEYERVGAKSLAAVYLTYTRAERFLRLMDMNEAAEMFRAMRMSSAGKETDAGMTEAVCDRFEAWYAALLETRDASPRGEFVLLAATAIRLYCLMALRTAARMPMLFGMLGGGARIATGEMEEMFDTVFDTDDGLVEAMLAYFSLNKPEADVAEEDESNGFFSSLCIGLYSDIATKDLAALHSRFEAMVEYLQSSPELCEDRENVDAVLTTVKAFSALCTEAGAYQTGAVLCERLLSAPLPSYHMHQLLLTYINLLWCMGAKEDAANAIEAAEELLPEALEGASVEDHASIRREQIAWRTMLRADLGDVDGAIEGCREIGTIGLKNYEADMLVVLDTVVNALLLAERRADACDLVEQYRELLEEYRDRSDSTEGTKRLCESLLAQLEIDRLMREGKLAAGGTAISESYYQRYAAEKKNGLFTMMAYNRVADGVKRFDFSSCTDEELAAHTARLRARAEGGEDKKKLAPEAFALVSEAGYRTLGYRHHRPQYLGAAAMLDGKIAEILNGEGKTYTIALVAYVNSLYHDQTFVIDDSPYLTERNYKWMRGIFTLLGVTVGHMMSQKTWRENKTDARIVYTDLATLGFDRLHRERSDDPSDRRDLSRCSAIVDEADVILVESAKKPIIIPDIVYHDFDRSGICAKAYQLAMDIKDDPQYCTVDGARVRFERAFYPLLEETFGIGADQIDRMEETVKLEQTVRLAIYCVTRKRGTDYFLREGKIFEEDTATGRLTEASGERGYFFACAAGLPTRSYEQSLQKKSGILNMTHVYGLLRSFGALSGTSATASSFKKEFKEIYGLETVAIPTVLPVKRVDRTVALYTTRKAKDRDILNMIAEKNAKGQPVLLVVKNVRDSQYYSNLLTAWGVPHGVLNAENAEQSPELLANAGLFGSVLVATRIANRGVDIKLGGDAERMTLLQLAEQGYDLGRLEGMLYTVPAEEERQTELYRSYAMLLEKNRAVVAVNREKVLAAGGLCVISTEPCEDMRIEQQTRGRAGRQGAVGESYLFESAEDEFFSDNLPNYDSWLRLVRSVGVELLDTGFLKRSLAYVNVQLHHATFRSMKQAAEISARVESSKREVFRLRDALRAEDEGAMTELLGRWTEDAEARDMAQFLVDKTAELSTPENEAEMTVSIAEANETEVRESLAEGRLFNGSLALLKLARLYPDVFGSQGEGSAEERMLAAAARRRGDEAWLPKPGTVLAEMLQRMLAEHLTDVTELENAYRGKSIKNVDRILNKAYRKDLNERLADTVGKWLGAEVKRS